MAAGVRFEGRCYASSAEAVDAFYTSASPSYTAGSTSYLSQYVKVGDVWKIQRYSISSTGTVSTLAQSNAPIPTFPACDTIEQFADGQVIGWGVALAMIAAWCIKNLSKGL